MRYTPDNNDIIFDFEDNYLCSGIPTWILTVKIYFCMFGRDGEMNVNDILEPDYQFVLLMMFLALSTLRKIHSN